MQKITISSSQSNTYAKISPEIGGILTELVLDNESVIVCPIQGDDYKKGFPSAFLFPFPSRIEDGKYSFEGQNYQLPINEPARGHAIHGFVAHQKFEVKSLSENAVSLIYKYTGDYEGYPFPFDFEVTYKLINPDPSDCFLSITYQATNTGKTNMPCAFGWHPYFQFGDSVDKLSVKMPAAKVIALDEKMIARGKSETIPARTIDLNGTTLDNGFHLEIEGIFCQTELIAQDKKLIIWQETGDNKMNYLVIYTPPSRQSVAIEPLTSNINAFNNGEDLIILEPNEKLSGEIRIWVEKILEN